MQDNGRKDRIQGAILGALIGDALGVGPHWYYDLDKLRRDYGEWIDDYAAPKEGRYHEGLEAGDWSQTGQVFVMLLESVAEKGGYLESDFTSRLDELLETLDGSPKSGRYTDEAMRDVWHDRMERGLSWEESGSFADTGEAAMRTAVLAGRYARDLGPAYRNMLDNVLVTHVNPFITGRSVAFGLVLFALINGASLEKVSKHIGKPAKQAGVPMSVPVVGTSGRAAAEGDEQCSFFDAILQPGWSYQAAHDPAVQIEPAYACCRLFGLACPLDFELPAALYLCSRFEGDFEFPVLHAVNGGGNNMARAAITGALAGAWCGMSAIPERFITGLADGERIVELAESVAEQAEAGEGEDEPAPEQGW
jgi:ADP-ribosylglycohydrolase